MPNFNFLFRRTAAGLALSVQILAAQETVRIIEGSRIRISVSGGGAAAPWIVGELRSISSDTLVLAVRSGHVRSIPRGNVTGIEISKGRRSSAVEGAVVGAAIGGLLGAGAVPGLGRLRTLGGWLAPRQDERRHSVVPGFSRDAFRGLVVGATAGSVLGLAIGAAIRQEGWEAILPSTADRPRVSLYLANGAGMQATLRF
jgi:hypothetical protein